MVKLQKGSFSGFVSRNNIEQLVVILEIFMVMIFYICAETHDFRNSYVLLKKNNLYS